MQYESTRDTSGEGKLSDSLRYGKRNDFILPVEDNNEKNLVGVTQWNEV